MAALLHILLLLLAIESESSDLCVQLLKYVTSHSVLMMLVVLLMNQLMDVLQVVRTEIQQHNDASVPGKKLPKE